MASIKKMSALLIPLILSIIANVALIFVAVHLNSKNEEQLIIVRSNQTKYNNVVPRIKRAEDYAKRLSRIIDGTDSAVPEEVQSMWLRPAEAERLNPLQDYTGNPFLNRPDRKSQYDYFTEYMPHLIIDRAIIVSEIQRQKTQLYKWEEAHLKITKEKDEVIAQKVVEIGELQSKAELLQEEKEQIAKEAAEAKTEYVFENQKLKQQIEEQQKTHNEEVAKLESHIAEREAKIRDLVKKKARDITSLNPDGEVLLADSDLGFAWIDLGRVNNIRKGLRFKVFRYIKGGRPKEKGSIEVKNVSSNTAFCAILETLDEKDPIVKGDYYISPLFDKNEQKVFVFAGELINTRYSRQELIKKIEEAGARVDPAITVETDFLVAGKDAEADEAFQRAIRLGVIIMREEELFDYLGD
ncbi:MAG: BRCT domain-containing protein [Planctomycetota bacterium]|jgi:hypothetical protein